MAALIALMLSAHAHRFDPAVLVLDETPSGWETRWTAPPGDTRVPLLPCGPPVTCPLTRIGVRGEGEVIIRLRRADGSEVTGLATAAAPWSPPAVARASSPWTPVAAVGLAWGAPERLAPFGLGLLIGGLVPGTVELPGWLALSTLLVARDALVHPRARRQSWAVVLGLAHGVALGELALPLAGLGAAVLLHRLPGVPWVVGALGAAGLLASLSG